MIVLDGTSLTQLQACKRRHILELTWRPRLWRPSSLFSHCLRGAYYSLSRGVKIEDVIAEASSRFMTQAAEPGLDAPGRDTYTLARDHVAMLGTVLTALAQSSRMVLHPVPDASLAGGRFAWRFSSWADDSGALHRLVTLPDYNEDTITREVHGWRTFGDMAVVKVPMTIHVVVIGSVRDGRRHSPWCRAYKSPTAPNLPYRFRRKPQDTSVSRHGYHADREEFAVSWKPLWLADSPGVDPAAWVKRMDGEGMIAELVKTMDIRQPGEHALDDARRQIEQECERAEVLGYNFSGRDEWLGVPMSRGACDAPAMPCPWQAACYSEGGSGLRESGLYQSLAQVARPSVIVPVPGSRVPVPRSDHSSATSSHQS